MEFFPCGSLLVNRVVRRFFRIGQVKGQKFMSKFIDVIGAVGLAACMVGCKSQQPTVDTMYSCSMAIGVSAGLVANECRIDDKARNEVIEVVGIVQEIVPATNQTFDAAWTPIAQAHVDKLVSEGKIDAAAGGVIMAAFHAAVVGIDYVFYRYPTAKKSQELASAAVDGFSDGFLTVFRPVDENVVRDSDAYLYDATALKHIRLRTK